MKRLYKLTKKRSISLLAATTLPTEPAKANNTNKKKSRGREASGTHQRDPRLSYSPVVGTNEAEAFGCRRFHFPATQAAEFLTGHFVRCVKP